MKIIVVEEYNAGNPYSGASYPGPGVYEVGNELFLVYPAPDGSLIVVGLSGAKGLVKDLFDVAKVQQLIHHNATLLEAADSTITHVAGSAIVDVHKLLDQIKSIVGAARQ